MHYNGIIDFYRYVYKKSQRKIECMINTKKTEWYSNIKKTLEDIFIKQVLPDTDISFEVKLDKEALLYGEKPQILTIINIFVHSIYLYDDHFTLIVNASKKPLSIDNIPLDDIEMAFESETGASEGCSSLMTPAPPITKRRTCGVFAYFPCISRFAAILILSQNKKYLHKNQYFCPKDSMKDSTNIKMQHEMQHETGKNCGYAFCRRFACGAGIAYGKTRVACGAGIACGKTIRTGCKIKKR